MNAKAHYKPVQCPPDLEEELVRSNDRQIHFLWTINLNGFFYNQIYIFNAQATSSTPFTRSKDPHEYQLIICPRSRDNWRNNHCSLFLYLLGEDLQVPKRVIIQCRIPGNADAELYFDLKPADFHVKPYEEGYIIAYLYNFISYSFFFKHLNVVPYFQIVADLMF